MRISRCQNEDDMCRRLFQRLKQCIKGLRSKHMHFIDDVDFISAVNRSKGQLFTQRFYFFNTAIRGSIYFKYIHGCTGSNALTVQAMSARMRRRPVFAVQRFSQNTRRTGFACTARSGKQIRVRNTSTGQCIAERSLNGLLTYQRIKILRPPAAV